MRGKERERRKEPAQSADFSLISESRVRSFILVSRLFFSLSTSPGQLGTDPLIDQSGVNLDSLTPVSPVFRF